MNRTMAYIMPKDSRSKRLLGIRPQPLAAIQAQFEGWPQHYSIQYLDQVGTGASFTVPMHDTLEHAIRQAIRHL